MNILFIEDERVVNLYNEIIKNIKEYKCKISKKENFSKIKTRYNLYFMFFKDIKEVFIYKEKFEDKNIIAFVEQTDDMMIFNILKYINIIDIIYIDTNIISIIQRIKSNIQMLEEGENEKNN